MPGRRPKPSKIKEMFGNAGKRRVNTAEPRPETGEPQMPKWITGAARKEWRAMAPELRQDGGMN